MNYSVLMSVYKNESPEFLETSITSILNQTKKTEDFVIVCDGILTKELDDVIAKYESSYPEIHVYKLKRNQGLGKALNFGLKKCKNELVARMDSDDISYVDRCELELEQFEKNKCLKLVGTFVEEFIDDPNKIIAVKEGPCTQEEIVKFSRRRNPFNHPTVMYSKSYVLKHGGYSSLRKGQDFELFLRLISDGMECMNINQPLLKFRRNVRANNRRKEWESVKTNIDIIYASLKRGHSHIGDLVYTVVTQIALLILPERCIDFVYLHFYRKLLK